MQGMILRHVSFVLALMAAVILGGCSQLNKGKITDPNFWESSPLITNNEDAELGLAELTKGNYGVAEAYFNKSLSRNDRDVTALMGLGILYQNTGQATKARQAYEAVLAIRPSNTQQMMVMGELSHRPIAELASVNLALLQSGMPLPANPVPGYNVPPNVAINGGVSGAPSASPMMGRVAPGGGNGGPVASAPKVSDAPMVVPLTDGDKSMAGRFETLRTLRDQGLITPDEYRARRQANVGALLPLSSPPPAAGLDRPVPNSGQIVGRLQAIGRALEMRAITISQHAAERMMILDALLPAAPATVANPGRPPNGLMEAADGVRRLEQLQAAGLITSDEYSRERAAIEKVMQPAPPRVAAAPSTPPASRSAAPSGAGGRSAVHLASFKSREQADRGWTQMRRAHQSLLGNLQPEITSVDLGQGKGTFFRVKAGPLANANAAKALCDELKRARQYCEPATLGGG